MRYSIPLRAALTITVSAITLCSALAAEEAAPTQSAAQIAGTAMEKFSWLQGEWEGNGWRATRDGKKTFNVHEVVSTQLDGLLLIVEGRGWSIDSDGNETEGHKAFGVFSYDVFAKSFHFDAFVKEGYQSRNKPEVGKNEFRWSHPAGPDATMHYHARLSKSGEWIESGERCVNEVCVQTMEMRLTKINP